jgi:hypothetical protein
MRAMLQGDDRVAITSAGGLNWRVAGFGPISDLGKSDMGYLLSATSGLMHRSKKQQR